MTTKITSILLIIMLFGSTLAPTSFAQTGQSKKERKAAKVKEKVAKFGTGDRARIKVKLYNDTMYRGYVKEAGEDSFVVVDKTGSLNTVSYADVSSISGKNLSTGAKIGIGIGIGAGVTLLVLYLVFKEITEDN